MAERELTLGCWDHDRMLGLVNGDVTVPGFRLAPHVLPTGQLFPLAVQEARFDITELSLSSYMFQVSRGTSQYTAVPAFIARAFRHNGFFRRAGSGIETLADFRGRSIGVPEYQMTAALWMRGILSDDYGVKATDISWRTGALNSGIRRERLALTPPPGLSIEPVSEGQTLQDLLLAGEIDGLLAPHPPKAFLDKDPRIERVFPAFHEVERDYFARTGFFPIMHILAIRRSLADEYPELPRRLYDACVASRDLALARLNDVWLGSANRMSLPWFNAAMEFTRSSIGDNYWAYGFSGAREELAAAGRYSLEQHLSTRLVVPEELFHPSVHDT